MLFTPLSVIYYTGVVKEYAIRDAILIPARQLAGAAPLEDLIQLLRFIQDKVAVRRLARTNPDGIVGITWQYVVEFIPPSGGTPTATNSDLMRLLLGTLLFIISFSAAKAR
jgi:hypothetical protein